MKNFNLSKSVEELKKVINYCTEQIEQLSNPQKYGCCISNCNTIVINRARMMTVKVEGNKTSYEFCSLTPTFFSPKLAKEIIKNDIFRDCNGNRIKLEGVTELEYFKMLKERTESSLLFIENVINKAV